MSQSLASHLLSTDRPVLVGTHNGEFHADDVLAVAALRLIVNVNIIRTRDPAKLAECDVIVDVGAVYDPATGRFDHHQSGRAGTRDNSPIFFSAFGLVWQSYGSQICSGDKEVAAEVDRTLVLPVDAADNGQRIVSRKNGFGGATPYSVSHVLGAMNPAWDDPARDYDAAFGRAVDVAEGIIRDAVRNAAATVAARRAVKVALAEAKGKTVVRFGAFNFDWADEAAASRTAKFVVYPSEDGSYWYIRSVPPKRGSFEQRLALPAAWAGVRGADLVALTGVEGAIFCHPGRWIAGAATLTGVYQLAELAITAD